MIRLIAFSLLLLPFFCFGQQPNIPRFLVKDQDFGSWTKAELIYDASKKLDLSARYEIRTDENSANLKQMFSQLSAKLDINKNFKTSFAWRSKVVNKEYVNEIQNRFHIDLTYRLKLGDLLFYSRIRSQYCIITNDLNEFYERFRLKVAYKINKKIRPFVYDELYFSVNNPNGPLFNKNRFGVGLDYKINKSINLDLKYLRIKDVNVAYPQIMNVVGLGLTYKLN